jgi:hypothetical protein
MTVWALLCCDSFAIAVVRDELLLLLLNILFLALLLCLDMNDERLILLLGWLL